MILNMKNNKKVIPFMIIAFLIILIIIFGLYQYKKNKDKNNPIEDYIFEEIDKNQISYQENTTVEELKNEIGATGHTDIYEIQQEYDGRNVITVKANIKYKAAFAGMIKKSTPKMEELDEILNKNIPKRNGIWVEKQSRDKILEIFNNDKVNSKYIIDNDGYLKIQDKNNQNDIDKKLEKIINGNRQYILDISSVCYIIDEITGEILDYNFENMDQYQTYEYFEDNNKMIIFVTQNKTNVLTDEKIFKSIIELL